MLYQILFSQNLTAKDAIIIFLISIFVFFISLTIHEFAHGFIAYKMGDLTPKIAGRLTINPFKHLDLTGFLCFMFLGVGWAKPVPINSLNFKKYKKGIRLVSISGVLANFILGLIAAIIFTIMLACGAVGTFATWVFIVLQYFMIVNSALALFNLLPIMPLDGYNFIASFAKIENKFIKFNQRYGGRILLWILLGSILIEILTGIDIFSVYLKLIYNYIYLPILHLGVL